MSFVASGEPSGLVSANGSVIVSAVKSTAVAGSKERLAARASVVLATSESALRETSAASVMTTTAGVTASWPPSSMAVVTMSTMLRASEPLMFAVALFEAPEVALAANVWVVSVTAPVVTGVTAALRTTPLAVRVLPAPTVARLLTIARLMPTAAPMLAVPPWVDAWPSASALASVLTEASRVASPVVVTVTPSASEASAVAWTRLNTTAAATDTLLEPPLPSLSAVDAAGVLESLEPVAPLRVAAALAPPSCESLWPLTSWLVPCDELESSAPAALAVAELTVVEVPWAASVTSPPAVRFRRVVARTVWFALRMAIDAPMAAEDASVSPVAVVVAEAVWVAVRLAAPPRVTAGPVPSCAVVVTLEIETATTGVIACAPCDPFSARLTRASVVVAETARAPARVSCAPVPIPAVVVSPTMLMPNEAPMPTPWAEVSVPIVCSAPVALLLSSVMAVPLVASDAEAASLSLVSVSVAETTIA